MKRGCQKGLSYDSPFYRLKNLTKISWIGVFLTGEAA